ncbi:preprotein translocase subunit SecE [Gimesia aquarii]|uniref:Protein translocase subunit SecE n=1 Tax=Gimesia aquarii TaxID=2527964 RepID=A0A517VQ01_9PLAN|nr:preprotein translocase subunit SecE [Gimesia aquarii]QDT95097.1 preprotein translocase subunit SecE [Gimesia aquarii]
MAKSKTGQAFSATLVSGGLYKRNQGRLVRQLTAIGLVAIAIFGAYSLYNALPLAMSPGMQKGIAVAVVVISTWLAYRVVNFPRFADFLISVEAEIGKVTWATWDQLWRSTAVVIVLMVLLALLLLAFDIIWQWFFRLIRFLQI